MKIIRALVVVSVFFVSCIFVATSSSQTFPSPIDLAHEKDVGVSFVAPTGWRLHPTERRYVYYLYKTSRSDLPNCPVGVGAQISSESLAGHQDATIGRVRDIYAGPSPAVVHRLELRSLSGVRILKADARFDTYLQPQLKRGTGFPVRCVIYTFRGSKGGRIYNLNCYPQPPNGAFFDKALDDMAKSISF